MACPVDDAEMSSDMSDSMIMIVALTSSNN